MLLKLQSRVFLYPLHPVRCVSEFCKDKRISRDRTLSRFVVDYPSCERCGSADGSHSVVRATHLQARVSSRVLSGRGDALRRTSPCPQLGGRGLQTYDRKEGNSSLYDDTFFNSNRMVSWTPLMWRIVVYSANKLRTYDFPEMRCPAFCHTVDFIQFS